MKIAIVTTHLKMGGIRRALLNMLSAVKGCGYEIDLYFLTGDYASINPQLKDLNIHRAVIIPSTDVFYKTWQQQGIKNKLLKLALGTSRKTIGGEKTIKQCVATLPTYGDYDIAFSYSNGIWTNGSKKFSGGCEYVVLDKINAKAKYAWIHSNPKNLGITPEICRRVYEPFDGIINVSNGCKAIYDEICPEQIKKSYVVHNFCDAARVRTLSKEKIEAYDDKCFHIITVARLDNKSKRLDRIVEICSRLTQKQIPFKWHIVGDGTDRDFLLRLIEEAHLRDVLQLHGRQDNPYPYIKQADLYVCTSDYEAFPMVLREAQLLGVPVVTTPIPPAVEMVTNLSDGIICNTFSGEEMAEEIMALLQDRNRLTKMHDYAISHSAAYDDSLNSLDFIFSSVAEK